MALKIGSINPAGGPTGATGPTGPSGPSGAPGSGGGGGASGYSELLTAPATFNVNTPIFARVTVGVGETYEIEAWFRYAVDSITPPVGLVFGPTLYQSTTMTAGAGSIVNGDAELWYDQAAYKKTPVTYGFISTEDFDGGAAVVPTATATPYQVRMRFMLKNDDTVPIDASFDTGFAGDPLNVTISAGGLLTAIKRSS